jgi:hypothetical protein
MLECVSLIQHSSRAPNPTFSHVPVDRYHQCLTSCFVTRDVSVRPPVIGNRDDDHNRNTKLHYVTKHIVGSMFTSTKNSGGDQLN